MHIKDYGEVLGHVFFGNEINRPLSNLLFENRDKAKIQKYVGAGVVIFKNGKVLLQRRKDNHCWALQVAALKWEKKLNTQKIT